MKNWIKFFGLSFFSDKIAAEAPKRGFAAIFLSLALSFVFFMCGFYAADTVPFSTHYKNAGQYTEFIDNAFGDGGIALEIKNKKARSEKLVNTYTNAADREKYLKNGYNLIIDTRRSDTLIKFTQVAVKGESEISYEEWRALTDAEKSGYNVTTRYTDEALEITADDAKVYAEFLSADENAKAEFEALNESADDYDEQLYYLYVKYYYTSVKSIYSGVKAPVLRDFYYRNYVSDGNAYYFYVFDDMCAGSFKTDGGVPVVFGGYFNKTSDGAVTDISALIKQVYYDTAGYTFTSYFVSAISQLPALVLIPLLLGLIFWGIGKLVKNGWEKRFSGCYKIVGSFVWFSALVTALVTFVCGFFATARTLYKFMALIFAGLLVIRTGVYFVLSVIRNKRATAQAEQQINEDIFGGEL